MWSFLIKLMEAYYGSWTTYSRILVPWFSLGVEGGRRIRQPYRILWAGCLENVGITMSQNSMGLSGQLQEWLYLFRSQVMGRRNLEAYEFYLYRVGYITLIWVYSRLDRRMRPVLQNFIVGFDPRLSYPAYECQFRCILLHRKFVVRPFGYPPYISKKWNATPWSEQKWQYRLCHLLFI
jgi:hypothetical protein